MSANVGLSTPRGSGTSGYVQRNLSSLKPRATGAGQPYSLNSHNNAPKPRKPDQTILNHDRLREVEVKVLELRDKLEEEAESKDEEADEDEIERKCSELRDELVARLAEGNRSKGIRREDGKGLKSYQVHELAEAKLKETDRLRKALGLKDLAKNTGEGGKDEEDEHPMARQERRRQERFKELADAEGLKDRIPEDSRERQRKGYNDDGR